MDYYKLTLVRPYIDQQDKIVNLENIIDNKESFPIYARLIGLASSSSSNNDDILVFEDIITGSKIYHSRQSNRFLGKEFLYYETYEEIDSLIAVSELNRLKREDIVRYRKTIEELKHIVRIDSLNAYQYKEIKKVKMPILSLRFKKRI